VPIVGIDRQDDERDDGDGRRLLEQEPEGDEAAGEREEGLEP
jgi:hypothetical protein